jgi:hypothetical protein
MKRCGDGVAVCDGERGTPIGRGVAKRESSLTEVLLRPRAPAQFGQYVAIGVVV